MEESFKKPEKFLTWLVIIIVFGVVAILAFSRSSTSQFPSIDPVRYQMVILEGNRQYVGHLNNGGTDHPYLTDVYLLKQDNAGGLTLFRFENDISAPEDVLYFQWSRIVLWTNVKTDSLVVQRIFEEKAQRTKSASAPTATTTSQ